MASQLGLLPRAENADEQDILRFLLGGAELARGRLHAASRTAEEERMWSELDEGILRVVVSYPIYHRSTWEADWEGKGWRGEGVDVGRAR